MERSAAGRVSGVALGHPSTRCHSRVAAGGDRVLSDLTQCWTESGAENKSTSRAAGVSQPLRGEMGTGGKPVVLHIETP